MENGVGVGVGVGVGGGGTGVMLKWCERRAKKLDDDEDENENENENENGDGNGCEYEYEYESGCVDGETNGMFEERALRLLEVNDEDVMDSLVSGRVVIRGAAGGRESDGECVVCIEDKSFNLVQKEVSNTMLMIPPEEVRGRYLGRFRRRKRQRPSDTDDGDIANKNETLTCETGQAKSDLKPDALIATHRIGNILELVRTTMDTDRLLVALRRRQYDEDYETESNGCVENSMGTDRGYSLDELLQHALASQDEVLKYLNTCEEAIQVGDTWFGISQDIVEKALDLLLCCCGEQLWSFSNEEQPLVEDEIVCAMSRVSMGRGITMYTLRRFGERLEEGDKWLLDEYKIATFKAISILRKSPKIPLDEFMSLWQSDCNAFVPNVELNLSLLRGEALPMPSPQSDVILHRLRSYELPQAPALRFESLFKFQPSWKWEDLEAYIRDIGAPKHTTESLLLKYTRKIMGEGGVTYVRK